MHSINVKGTYLCMRECGKLMAKTGGGTIVTISSVHGLGGTHFNSIYVRCQLGVWNVSPSPAGANPSRIAMGTVRRTVGVH